LLIGRYFLNCTTADFMWIHFRSSGSRVQALKPLDFAMLTDWKLLGASLFRDCACIASSLIDSQQATSRKALKTLHYRRGHEKLTVPRNGHETTFVLDVLDNLAHKVMM
jgi:hypothetical protein